MNFLRDIVKWVSYVVLAIFCMVIVSWHLLDPEFLNIGKKSAINARDYSEQTVLQNIVHSTQNKVVPLEPLLESKQLAPQSQEQFSTSFPVSDVNEKTCRVITNDVFRAKKEDANNRFFTFNLVAPSVSKQFENRAYSRLVALFEFFERMLIAYAPSSMRQNAPISINLYVLADRSEYEAHVASYGASAQGNKGLYLGSHNVGLIEYRVNDATTLNTLVHEATHALVYYTFGLVPRWLSEGLAEYFEGIHYDGEWTNIPSNRAWLKDEKLRFQFLELGTLVTNEQQWDTALRHALYANSWHLIYFLMNNERGRQALFTYLIMERSNPCNVIDGSEIEGLLLNSYETLESDYIQWRNEPLQSYRFKLQ
ncbi:DUF1570 domain-containing protein (plasmid) [Pseudoalteromonas sp. T1lg65]|uniref:DUF1570 domain-containing protein n=1 Tax=Pseudoalteromonas sp. T1lg65 TaxID=2077101 RepID=UPI003F798F82